jgi:hypothetical protein
VTKRRWQRDGQQTYSKGLHRSFNMIIGCVPKVKGTLLSSTRVSSTHCENGRSENFARGHESSTSRRHIPLFLHSDEHNLNSSTHPWQADHCNDAVLPTSTVPGTVLVQLPELMTKPAVLSFPRSRRRADEQKINRFCLLSQPRVKTR